MMKLIYESSSSTKLCLGEKYFPRNTHLRDVRSAEYYIGNNSELWTRENNEPLFPLGYGV